MTLNTPNSKNVTLKTILLALGLESPQTGTNDLKRKCSQVPSGSCL
jgi:hypothetical protein